MIKALLILQLLIFFSLSTIFSQNIELEEDLSFGHNGNISIPTTSSSWIELKTGAQYDGKLCVAINYLYDSTNIQRINPEGTLDSAFSPEINDSLNLKKISHIIDCNSGIYLLGISESDYFFPIVIKLNYSGEIDTTFNKSGFLGFTQDTLISFYEEIKIAKTDPEKLYINYRTKKGNSEKLTLRVINNNGSLDPSYITYLLEKTDSIYDKSYYLFSAKITPDDKILLSGQHDPEWYFGMHSNQPSGGDGLIVKLNNDGSVCESFGDDGILLIETEKINLLKSVLILQDMNLLLEGHISDFAITGHLALKETGEYDTVRQWLEPTIYKALSFYNNYEYLEFPNGDLSIISGNYLLDIDWEQNVFDTIFTASAITDYALNNHEELFISQYSSSNVIIRKYLIDTISTPEAQISNLTTTWNTKEGLSIKWTKGTGVRRLIFMTESDSKFPGIKDRKTYYPSMNWDKKLSEIEESGWYCVYNGTGDSLQVNSLDSTKTYWIAGIECNGASGWERYNHTVSEKNKINTDKQETGLIISKSSNLVEVYPNPGKEKIFIKFNSSRAKQVRVINLKGDELFFTNSINSNLIIINTMEFSPGIYFIQTIFEDELVTKKIIIR